MSFWSFKGRTPSKDSRLQGPQGQLPDAYKEFLNFHNQFRNYKEVNENGRRRLKRFNNESSIEEKKLKRETAKEDRKGWRCWLRWYHWLYWTEHFGPETYDIRPTVVQMRLYILNAIQGIVAGITVIFFHITNSYNIPQACGLFGLYILLYFPAGLDFFGSIFGMITSYHLEGTFGYRKTIEKKTNPKNPPSVSRWGRMMKKESPPNVDIPDPKTEKEKPKTRFRYLLSFVGPCCLCNIILRLCLKRGRSRTFVNVMGYLSWILLQLAWFFNLFFVAYYHWRHIFFESYRNVIDPCKNGNPKPSYCADFDSVYSFLFNTMAVTFVIRNILVFFIGMCFKETPLRRYPPPTSDPTVEIPSTCSDTDIDYSKVPEPLLRPYLRREPWMQNWPIGGISKGLMNDGRKSKRKRVLTVREAQAEKTLQVFNDIRRAKPTLGKKRRDVRIRKVKGAPDTIQMPAELLTAKARAWLSEDETDESQKGKDKTLKSHMCHYQQHSRRPVTRRRVKGTKKDSSSSESLVYIHDPDSKTLIPLSKVVRQKLKDLSDRVSTDDSWSGNTDSLFEAVPANNENEQKNDDAKEGKTMEDEYLALRMEMGSDSNESVGTVLSENPKSVANDDAMSG
ncbi:unnamed protein product [Orchesella dallaii]|uniref:Uncharacterized protein n=1 Tax=Orchesella dallaii TaxID=48710 RepID=A0ABP1S283_9HEXA